LRSALAPNRCLDVFNAFTFNGTKIQIWECNGTNAQNWYTR
ncbi:MAG: hydrolase, partial [Myxococcaceae bacterium]